MKTSLILCVQIANTKTEDININHVSVSQKP